MYKAGPLLEQITFPSDLRSKFTIDDLPQIADELRQYIIDVISEIGNSHFGASLGVVELTVALHYIFDTPNDLLVWDVGHQAYGHKILTGRRNLFDTNRKKDGLSGFPTISESNYDTFGVGHSSTSVSAALGMAIANQYNGHTKRKHIAVIGDGALTAGMAFEGLNHAGSEKEVDLMVVLNDNCMAIDPNVGALKDYLTSITTPEKLLKTQKEAWKILKKISTFGEDKNQVIEKISSLLKHQNIKQSNLFESLNFSYFGPIDGHDVIGVAKILELVKDVPGPKIVHCVTKKGWGYKYSQEGNPTEWHAPGVFDKSTGIIQITKDDQPKPPKYQDVFGLSLVELAEQNNAIMAITPAMTTGSSLHYMMEKFPNRTFDVGIAEQHAVTFSAGLATQGILPYCTIYSTFLQRAFDQIIHDVALQKLNVVLCIDRAGLVGADGATHHGAFDIAYLRQLPNMIVSAPMDEIDLRNLMFTAQLKEHGPFSIRYPRGRGNNINWRLPFEEIEIGKGRKLSNGKDIAILTIGHPGIFVQEIVNNQNLYKNKIAHYDMRFVKPIDEQLLHEICQQFNKIITVEDGCLTGGFGTAVLEFISDNNYSTKVKRLGIPDHFIHHGTQEELWAECGFNVNGIVKSIESIL